MVSEPQETFFDPETGDLGIPQFSLEHVSGPTFRLLSRIGYRHPDFAGEFIVPRADGHDTYTTDLTSIPPPFRWLVPVIGDHLAPALLHDGLVTDGPPQHDGPEVTRRQADDLFRDAMRLAGTRRIRRWLIWTGVSFGTMWEGDGFTWIRRLLMIGYFMLLAAIGLVATADLFDVSWSWMPSLPWMGDRPWWVELIGGGAVALILPTILSLAWGPRRTVGRIAGIALAFLLHPTLLVGMVSALYLLAEGVASREEHYDLDPGADR